ncbi:RNA-directed DNA polymerase, eukaryota, reverse transcriptase zinc-binding domain protein [Tanacetum coccineum]
MSYLRQPFRKLALGVSKSLTTTIALLEDNIKDVDTSSEFIDDHSVDDLKYIQTNLTNIVNQVSKQKMDIDEENKQGEEDIHLIAESSNLSRPPGFEFMKKSSSPSSKCSTSFARFRKKEDKVWHGVVSGGLISKGPSIYSQRIPYGLVDLPIGGRCFTWMNKAGTKLSKLDRFLISEDVIDLLPDIRITALDNGFDDLIKSEWDSLDSNNSGFPTKCHEKFRILKAKIRQWNNNNKTIERNKKAAALEELSSIEKKIDEGSASPSDTENRLNLLHELEIIDKFASMDLIQKARVKWDIEGDENTKFFHGLINQKRRNQMINVKFQAQDSQVSFPNLPHSQTLNSMDRDYLERLVTHEEIKEAVWDCGSSKAPGPDGFSFAFVKKYWDIIKKDLHDFINSFFASCDMPYGANSSFFTLIPKVNNPTLITDFRPISLIGIHYKIIAKILANRLSKVIDKIVSKEQSAFIVGHHILDSLGFGLKWRSWIKTCLSSSRASILVNGSPISEFFINRGLRQGDPLSHFLFILVLEGLHNAFADPVGNGLISGININNSSIHISHLFFPDDVIITTGWNARDLENIIRVLNVFYLASGLKINIHKSNIYGIVFNKDEVYNMASNAGCIAGNIPFNYLGLPIGSNMKSIASWKMLIDCFRSRLSTWKASLLSIGGHLTLIKSVLGSLGIYYLSFFRVPESVLNDLERIRSNFF